MMHVARITWAFLVFVEAVLATLAYSSWRVCRWAWQMMLVVYGIGAFGNLYRLGVGIPKGSVAAGVNAAVFLYAIAYGGADLCPLAIMILNSRVTA